MNLRYFSVFLLKPTPFIMGHMSGNVNAKQRHDIIFDAYTKFISELGVTAREVRKQYLYNEVALRTGYSKSHVSHVINMKFKKEK